MIVLWSYVALGDMLVCEICYFGDKLIWKLFCFVDKLLMEGFFVNTFYFAFSRNFTINFLLWLSCLHEYSVSLAVNVRQFLSTASLSLVVM